ncbi:MAG: O-methyltransferase [Candidatus Zixiibacteriota bacterium]
MNSEAIDKYLLKMTPARTGVLCEMEAYGKRRGFPMIGPLAGRLLYQLARSIKAKRIIELGSGFGYSAMWFAMAAGPKGHLILTDNDSANRDAALEFFKRARLRCTIEYHVGDALEIAKGISKKCDILLNDIDKKDYPETIPIAARLVRKEGLFITDNLIWSGRVMNSRQDRQTKAIVDFTRRLYRDERFFTTIMPLRDGIAIATRR